MRDIGDLLREALAEEGLERVEDLLAIKRAWERTEGLPRGTPCGFRGGKLVVRVDTHAWAQELSVRRMEVVDKIKDKTGLQIGDIIIKYKPKV